MFVSKIFTVDPVKSRPSSKGWVMKLLIRKSCRKLAFSLFALSKVNWMNARSAAGCFSPEQDFKKTFFNLITWISLNPGIDSKMSLRIMDFEHPESCMARSFTGECLPLGVDIPR